MEFMESVFSCAWIAATLLFLYLTFQKMGITPWKGLVPGYNLYILCQEFDGNGWRVFMFLIPVYNIILWFRLCRKWAAAFGKSKGWSVGLALLTPIFLGFLALDNKVFYQKNVVSAE